MTDFTINLVDAIISGRATDIELAFQEAITDKISIAMETKRTNIAQSMFKESVELDEATGVYKHTKGDKKGVLTKTHDNYNDAEIHAKILNKNKFGGPGVKYKVKDIVEDYSLEEIEDFMMSEEFEQLDELSKATLGSYVKKASAQQGLHSYRSGMAATSTSAERKAQGWDMEHDEKKSYKRKLGIIGAANKLSK